MEKRILTLIALSSVYYLANGNFTIAETPKQDQAYALSFPQTDELEIKLGGYAHSMYGVSRQKKDFFPKFSCKRVRRDSLINKGEVKVEIKAKSDNAFEYGGAIEMNMNRDRTSKDSLSSKVFVYAQGLWGKLQFGKFKGPSASMALGGEAVAAGTGGVDGDYLDFVSGSSIISGTELDNSFIQGPGLYVDAVVQSKINRIAYFSPEFNGLSFGIDYVPDSSSHGSRSSMNNITKISGKDFINVATVAANHNAKLDKVELKTSAIYQTGKAKRGVHEVAKRKDLSAWMIGFTAKYKEFELGASYGDWGRSGTAKEKQSGSKYKAKFYTVGAAYSHTENLKFSLTHFKSKKGSNVNTELLDKKKTTLFNSLAHPKKYNKFSSTSLGAEYKFFDGMLAYVEFVNFRHKHSLKDAKNNKGNIYFGGIKINF